LVDCIKGNATKGIPAHNPNVTSVQEYHNLRPISETFLNTILNRDEFAQNLDFFSYGAG
jgi:hypothetical protein